MKRNNKKAILAVFILISVLLALLQWSDFPWRRSKPDNSIDILYSLSLKNTSPKPIHSARLDVYGPVALTATQKCEHIEANHPHTLAKDTMGNQLLSFGWDTLPPLSTKVITIQSKIQTWRAAQPWLSLDPEDALAPEPFIESEDAGIQAQAEKLKANSGKQTVKNIFEWVAAHIEYAGYIKKNRGAVYALKYRKGDCTEFAALFVALCRANKIPAHMLGGFICPSSTVISPGDYHNWAVFYLDGRWHPADPQNNKFMEKASHYIALQIIRPSAGLNGFIISKVEGKGLKAKLQ